MLGWKKVKKWSLMSPINVPLVKEVVLLFVKMWSIRVELPFCILVALRLVKRKPELVMVEK